MRGLFAFLAIVSLVALIFTGVSNILKSYTFTRDCESYLKLAGDSPNLERAHQFLSVGLSYIEKNNLTEGNSALIFHNQDANLNIWYHQLKAADEGVIDLLERAKANPGSVSDVDKSNQLIKLRETVLDQGESGVMVTRPPHLPVYPHQVRYCWLYILSVSSLILFGILTFATLDWS